VDSPARVGRLRNRLSARLSLGAKIVWLLSFCGFTSSIGFYPSPAWVNPLLGTLAVATVGGLVAMVLSWMMSLLSGDTPGHVTFHDGVLRLKKNRDWTAIAKADITSAHAQAGGVVEITTRAGDQWILDMQNEEDAAKLVDELGWSPGGRPATYALGSRYRRFLHFAVAFMSYQLGSMAGGFLGILMAVGLEGIFGPGQRGLQFVMFPMIALGFALAFAAGKRLIRAPVVTVGNDGVWVQTFGFKKRFIAIGDIVMAHQASVGGAVRLKLRDNSIVHLAGFLVDPGRRDAAAIHIRTLLARHAELQKSSVALAREGRSVREWREHLRRVVEGAGYRVAAASDSLADLVGAPGVTSEERIGAALALRVAGEANVPRIRIAAEQCVDPKTRAALEAAAQDEIDEQAIEKALR
jgi:hypothetical protein